MTLTLFLRAVPFPHEETYDIAQQHKAEHE
jgi:hypothetical protein